MFWPNFPLIHWRILSRYSKHSNLKICFITWDSSTRVIDSRNVSVTIHEPLHLMTKSNPPLCRWIVVDIRLLCSKPDCGCSPNFLHNRCMIEEGQSKAISNLSLKSVPCVKHRNSTCGWVHCSKILKEMIVLLRIHFWSCYNSFVFTPSLISPFSSDMTLVFLLV